MPGKALSGRAVYKSQMHGAPQIARTAGLWDILKLSWQLGSEGSWDLPLVPQDLDSVSCKVLMGHWSPIWAV